MTSLVQIGFLHNDASTQCALTDPEARYFFPGGLAGMEVAYHPLCVEGFAMALPVHDSSSALLGREIAGALVCMYRRDFFPVPSSFVRRVGSVDQRICLASDSISLMTLSGISRKYSQYLNALVRNLVQRPQGTCSRALFHPLTPSAQHIHSVHSAHWPLVCSEHTLRVFTPHLQDEA